MNAAVGKWKYVHEILFFFLFLFTGRGRGWVNLIKQEQGGLLMAGRPAGRPREPADP